ncbi:MAG: RHS repeat-associated core domain-containing protein, partial [Pseudomonadota bacterium]
DAGLIQKLTYPSAVTAENAFDNAGALASITVKNTLGTLEALTYTYINDMTISSINSTRDGGLHTYAYDGLDQLTQVTHPAGFGLANEAYQYDKVGNRDLPSDLTIYQYDNNHRITQSPGLLQYTYDTAGNQTGRSDGVVMTYDTDNRLISYTKGTTSATYVYDPFGHRIKKTVNGVVTFYVWDGSKLSAEYSATGVRQKRYAYLPDTLSPIQVEDTNGIYNVSADNLGTTRFLTNSAQKIVWSAKQSAFGEMLVNEDPDANGVTVTYNPRFAGQYFDKESGLHQNYFRDYDPSIGRYIQSDPIGLDGGINTYVYVSANPMMAIDQFGLSQMCHRNLLMPIPYARHCYMKYDDGSTSSYDPSGVKPDPDQQQEGTVCTAPQKPEQDNCIKKAMEQCKGANYNFTQFNCCHCAEQAMKQCGVSIPTPSWPNWPMNPGPQPGEPGYSPTPVYDSNLGGKSK